MADHYAIASELFQHVLEKRRRSGELTTPALDQSNRRRYPFAVSGRVLREAVNASRTVGVDEATWNRIRRQRQLEG